MVDEFYERYRREPHEKLHQMLAEGRPEQVDAVAETWHRVEQHVGGVADGLRAELSRVLPAWDGGGSREFQYRLGLIVAYAEKLAAEASVMRTGLTVMARALADTQRLAEPDRPEPPPADPAALLLGRVLAGEEREKARERVTVLVARLAADYAVADHRIWPACIPAEPADLPAGVSSGSEAVPGIDDTLPARVDALASSTPAPAVTALAGAADLRAMPAAAAAVSLPSGPITASPGAAAVPVSVLGGAGGAVTGAGLAGAVARDPVDRPATAVTAQVDSAGVPMMGGAGLGFGGRPSEGYAVTDGRLAEGTNAWETDGDLDWQAGADAPPPILRDQVA
ncbi:hypothetical protein Asi02nite_33070 [Asanoa siamensis]|uniref:PPE family protein n=1 Tax=Asanoa siamensis TaxID=926357 RepID=A0ABQ4CR65_9ACTN|nr:hypothetical protein Asi02nite_33070 [Asanoa siamensis]